MSQSLPQSHMAYDRTIVVFSPEGRLLQVEYARQMVNNGQTSVGLRTKDSVILAGVKLTAPLLVSDSYKKISSVDDHVAIIFSGSFADARDLIQVARVKAQVNRITYGEPISISSLTTYLCDRMHLVTQYAGVRPYGVGLLIGGVDEGGPKLYETDPSGTMIEWFAQAIGKGSAKAKTFLAKNYKKDITTEAGIKLVLKTLKVCEKKATVKNIGMVVVTKNKVQNVEIKELERLIK